MRLSGYSWMSHKVDVKPADSFSPQFFVNSMWKCFSLQRHHVCLLSNESHCLTSHYVHSFSLSWSGVLLALQQLSESSDWWSIGFPCAFTLSKLNSLQFTSLQRDLLVWKDFSLPTCSPKLPIHRYQQSGTPNGCNADFWKVLQWRNS